MSSHLTQDDLDRLDRAIATGTRSVQFSDGRRLEFSTFQELVARREFVAQQLAQEGGRQRLFTKFKKGVSP